MDAKQLGAFIAQRRKELGMTQAGLAEKLHVTDKAVSRWERGIGLPDINSLEALAQALEVSLVELMQMRREQHDSIPTEDAEHLLVRTIRLSAAHRGVTRTAGIVILSIFGFIAAFLLMFALGANAAFYTAGGIAAGLMAWSFPVWQMTLDRRSRTGLCAAASLCFGMICLLLEFSYLVYKAQIGDWAAIEDTAAALLGVAAIYTAITVGLNIMMLAAAKLKERIG